MIQLVLRFILLSLITFSSFAETGNLPQHIIRLDISDSIGPATADYLIRGIHLAHQEKASLIILTLDTPGGLETSMRSINKSILSSQIPIIGYVAPSGARAASAGTFILYACHVAAMAPGTNLGAASPVGVSGNHVSASPLPSQPVPAQQETMKKKVTNDAIAYIRSLAQLRGRNEEFAVNAVKEAATMSASDALKANVIEIVASDVPDLLKQLNGRQVTVDQQEITINTSNHNIKTLEPDWRARFLAVITNPSVAYILLLLGAYGIFFEFANPGFVLPGVVGAIALLLALYALQLLPISYAGLGLILLGIAFMVGEAFVPSFGALGLGGIISFVIGSILLFDTEIAAFQIAWPIIFGMACANVIVFTFIIGMALKAQRRKIVSGREDMIGKTGVALHDFQNSGQARIGGEIWQVRSEQPVQAGDPLIVIHMEGLMLTVKINENNKK